MNYQEALDWLYSTQTFGIKLGLEGPTRLLREFLAFPSHRTKVIHVAGTNGKGSTCAMIDALGQGLALRSGLFTSPHLIDYRERVRVNGLEISEEKTARLLTELRELVADWDHHPTFFELTLALGMRHFRDSDCDLIVLETGMGGRLDATTAIPADVCILTPISLDHTKWLGSTLDEIAREKAAIAIKGKPILSSPQEPEAEKAIRQVTNQTQAPLTFIKAPLLGYSLSLPGEHQKQNAALACEAIVAAGLHLSFDVVQHSLQHVRWPGRFERITDSLILDAAHNPHAAQALVETWQSEFPGKKAAIIFGSVEDKATDEVLSKLSEIAEEFHFVPVTSQRGLPPESHEVEVKSIVHPNLTSALEATAGRATLLTGSLFLLGEAKAFLSEKKFRKTSQ
ncbi:bifunctional folylpolyglutamate synthase/dihydrofolate synthase [Akkermansiaceae bacterium]|nr:bifunctional folylpolyglutamate synthase/dihydrofolate synthase [Akkermansiaceae bacterium]MDA7868542.1 bifunctional folylpolyglutamate synthase/dihydrofolate synthase [bacterium]MDA9830352.1 bifunctional folylpolyglutamate synthase/dihydrofolate synthase [Akkermansiaceae bacterium]MDB4383916.1 bifunctional folylpolyglutamate synthase/dihydrofolate synthase [Akkermansiaceae bacterium]MDB4464870.1 bifunctional folylpolyglutamate synthase/dihydrofolate synthase [Akkermansiaceae bacterium]